MKVRKKPIEVDAVQYVGVRTAPDGSNPLPRFHETEPMPDWLYDALAHRRVELVDGVLSVRTMEGALAAVPGSWIIRAVAGELYPCDNAVFKATYDLPPAPTW